MLDYGTPRAAPDAHGHLMHNLLLFGRVLTVTDAARVPGNIKMATAGLAYGPRFELESLKLIANYLDGAE